MSRLIDEHGRDLGEIIETSWKDSGVPGMGAYEVYVREVHEGPHGVDACQPGCPGYAGDLTSAATVAITLEQATAEGFAEAIAANEAALDARPPYTVAEDTERQFWAYFPTARIGAYPTRNDAELGALARISADKSGDGEVLLCDLCWEVGTGDLAQCQDVCNLSLDHDGECAGRVRPGQTECDRCGRTDRLTRVDVSDLDFT